MSFYKLQIYFPQLKEQQKEQFIAFEQLLRQWNKKVNLISRKDTEYIFINHILHSLSLAFYMSFSSGEHVLDLGTGGGFPGIPLSVYFPKTHFTLVDSIAKKVNVVESMTRTLGLRNTKCVISRVENIKQMYDFVVCRAVAPLGKIEKWCRPIYKKNIICLKGGDLTQEIKPFGKRCEVYSIAENCKESFFETKKIVFLRR